MTRMTTREAIRLLMVAFGVVCVLIACLIALPLLLTPGASGTIEFRSSLVQGEPTNRPVVVWGRGVALPLESGDISPPPKAGDSVTVLAYGKGGTLKYGRSYWIMLGWAGGFAAAGVALVIGGLFLLRRHSMPPGIVVTQSA